MMGWHTDLHYSVLPGGRKEIVSTEANLHSIYVFRSLAVIFFLN